MTFYLTYLTSPIVLTGWGLLRVASLYRPDMALIAHTAEALARWHPPHMTPGGLGRGYLTCNVCEDVSLTSGT